MSGAVFTEADRRWMRRALALGLKGRPLSNPNPAVGCVIVRDGEVLGEGFTQQAGGPHAEVMALRDADARGRSVEGATVYVTLEPCSHTGRTPPCARALVARRVARVVAAAGDPNPLVCGRGFAILREAGIEVASGLYEAESRANNPGFIRFMETGRPWVRIKTAVSLDGRTALPNGRSKWITGEAARADGQSFRAAASAVVTGVGTVLADDPQLTVRSLPGAHQPARVVLDSSLRTPPEARLFSAPGGGPVLVCCADPSRMDEGFAARRSALEAAGAEVCPLPDAGDPSRVGLEALIVELGRRKMTELHVEAGARLTGSFISGGLADELLVYMAPLLLGDGAGPARLPAIDSPDGGSRWQFFETVRLGDDMRMLLRRK